MIITVEFPAKAYYENIRKSVSFPSFQLFIRVKTIF